MNTTKAKENQDGSIVADRALALTEDRGTVTPAGHASARYELAMAGDTIPADEVKRLRLTVVNDRVKQQPPKGEAPKATTKPARTGATS